MSLRPLVATDLPSIARLVEGRNVHADEYARFLRLEGAYGMVVEEEGAMLGAVTAMRYFERGFIGPVLLGERDASGVAAALLARVVEGFQRAGVTSIDAEASPQESAILRAMGFEAERRTLVIEREPAAAAPFEGDTQRAREMRAADLLDVGALDAAAVGYGRKEYLAALRTDFPEGARVVDAHDADVTGYVLLRRARRGYHLGPLVTQREGGVEVASALLDEVVMSVAASPLVALVPDGTLLAPTLSRHGFEKVAELVRMRVGPRASEAEGARDATEWVLGGRITG